MIFTIMTEEGYYGFGMDRVLYVKPGYDSKKYRKAYESNYGNEHDEMVTLEINGYFDAGNYADFSKTRTFVVDTCFTEYSYGYDTMIKPLLEQIISINRNRVLRELID
jgi:hypothetical protein